MPKAHFFIHPFCTTGYGARIFVRSDLIFGKSEENQKLLSTLKFFAWIGNWDKVWSSDDNEIQFYGFEMLPSLGEKGTEIVEMLAMMLERRHFTRGNGPG